MVRGWYTWEDDTRDPPEELYPAPDATPREAFDEELLGTAANIEVLALVEEPSYVLAIIKHIEDKVIGIWLFTA